MSHSRRNASIPLYPLSQQANDDDQDTTDGAVTTPDDQPVIKRRKPVANNDTTSTTATTVVRTIPLAFTYDDFWRSMRRNRILIAGASFAIGLFTLAIFLMWLFRRIPSMPPSFLYYGFVWYILIFFTAVLDFAMAFTKKRELYVITLVINVGALFVVAFMIGVIIYQIVICAEGTGDTNCQTLYFTRFLLLFLTIAIGLLLLVLIFLFALVIVRFGQIYLQLTNQRRMIVN